MSQTSGFHDLGIALHAVLVPSIHEIIKAELPKAVENSLRPIMNGKIDDVIVSRIDLMLGKS